MKITILTYLASEHAKTHDVVVDQVAEALRKGGHKPSILRVHGDLGKLIATLVRLRNEHITLRIAALGALREPHALFERMEGAGAFVTPSQLTSGSSSTTRIGSVTSRSPSWALLGAAILLTLALAANELWCGRLTFVSERTA